LSAPISACLARSMPRARPPLTTYRRRELADRSFRCRNARTGAPRRDPWSARARQAAAGTTCRRGWRRSRGVLSGLRPRSRSRRAASTAGSRGCPRSRRLHLDGPEGVTATRPARRRHVTRSIAIRARAPASSTAAHGDGNAHADRPRSSSATSLLANAPRFPSPWFRKLSLHGDESGDLVVLGETNGRLPSLSAGNADGTCQVCEGGARPPVRR